MGLLNYAKPGALAGPRGLLDYLLAPDGMSDGSAPSPDALPPGFSIASLGTLASNPGNQNWPEAGDAPVADPSVADPASPGGPSQTGTGGGYDDSLPGDVIQLAAAQPPAPAPAQARQTSPGRQISARDRNYLNRYYPPTAALARRWGVDPALVLGMGGESGFGTAGTYLRTGDAFGMTGGSTRHMTHARNPTENVQQFFDRYGPRIRGDGSNVTAFVNALQGTDVKDGSVGGWKKYNNVNASYADDLTRWIGQMQRDLPAYQQRRSGSAR